MKRTTALSRCSTYCCLGNPGPSSGKRNPSEAWVVSSGLIQIVQDDTHLSGGRLATNPADVKPPGMGGSGNGLQEVPEVGRKQSSSAAVIYQFLQFGFVTVMARWLKASALIFRAVMSSLLTRIRSVASSAAH